MEKYFTDYEHNFIHEVKIPFEKSRERRVISISWSEQLGHVHIDINPEW